LNHPQKTNSILSNLSELFLNIYLYPIAFYRNQEKENVTSFAMIVKLLSCYRKIGWTETTKFGPGTRTLSPGWF
jgi:hypothetical protein